MEIRKNPHPALMPSKDIGRALIGTATDKAAEKTGDLLHKGITAAVSIGIAALGKGAGILGTAGMASVEGIGRAGIFIGKTAGNAVWKSLNQTNGSRNIAGAAVKGLWNAGGKLVRFERGRKIWNPVKGEVEKTAGGLRLTGFGKAALTGSVLSGAVFDASRNTMNERMGAIDDSRVYSAAPSVIADTGYGTSAPIDYAGATGDLVFALNANRQGGYLR